MKRTTQIKTVLGVLAAAALLFAVTEPTLADRGFGPGPSFGHETRYVPAPVMYPHRPTGLGPMDWDRHPVVIHRPTFCPPPVIYAPPVIWTQPVVYPQPVVIERPIVVTRPVYVSRPTFGLSFGIGW